MSYEVGGNDKRRLSTQVKRRYLHISLFERRLSLTNRVLFATVFVACIFSSHLIDAVYEPMDEAGDSQDAEPVDKDITQAAPLVVNIVPNGDVILDVEFQNSRETLKSTRKATLSHIRPNLVSSAPQPELKPRVKVAYRVRLAALKLHSKYFENLLSDTRFQEARSIEIAFQKLSLKGVGAEEVEAQELPWVKIVDDDEATRAAGREVAFGDLLRILHNVDTITKSYTFNYVATLAVLADRFDCVLAVTRYMPRLKPKWPLTQPRAPRDDGVGLTKHTEELLRQKILVAWLLDQPLRLAAASRELIMYGSVRWSAFAEADSHAYGATWWDLQDDLEREIQYRRECILNTIASAIRHFLGLYTSRVRQCKLGYDSSLACDSYQLGEMVRFLGRKGLLSFVDFSPTSLDTVPDHATIDIMHILATLKDHPNYQIDRNHTNCGLRNRIIPIADFIQSLLSSKVIAIRRHLWVADRQSESWLAQAAAGEKDKHEKKVFRFTRSVAADPRLRHEGAMGADRLARDLFTAHSWDWTPEE